MPGLDPGTQVFTTVANDLDPRVKPEEDEKWGK
jgi:hypothetical protein